VACTVKNANDQLTVANEEPATALTLLTEMRDELVLKLLRTQVCSDWIALTRELLFRVRDSALDKRTDTAAVASLSQELLQIVLLQTIVMLRSYSARQEAEPFGQARSY
jgi:hypothetical protein